MKVLDVLLMALALGATSSRVQVAGSCPDGYWQDENSAQCLITVFDAMTLVDAEKYCAELPVPGRLFQPTASSIGILKTYADETILPNPDLWGRYWVGLTQDLSDAWKRNVVDRRPGGPFCVALDYRRPIDSQQASFHGFDSPDCRSDIQLPGICSVDETVEVLEDPAPEPISPVQGECPQPAPCPECPAPVPCPIVDCPPPVACKEAPPVLPPLPPRANCPPTWFTRNEFCYHFIIASKTWEGASASCRKDGAELVYIMDQEENDYLGVISDELSDARPTMRRYWIGLNDRDQEGSMAWTSGDPVGFTSWGPRQPSIHKKRRFDENCVVINSQNVALWSDISCWRRHPYICKKAASVIEE